MGMAPGLVAGVGDYFGVDFAALTVEYILAVVTLVDSSSSELELPTAVAVPGKATME